MAHLRLITFNFLFLFFGLVAFGQPEGLENNIIPPPPETEAYVRFGSAQVNGHTGTPNIGLPLFDLKGKNLDLNVNLSYNGSGVRVKEESTWVGHNWTLNAGGVITRTVLGVPDDEASFGFTTSGNLTHDLDFPHSDHVQTWEQDIDEHSCFLLSQGTRDQFPDVFHFNFGNYSGSFSIPKDGSKIYCVPYQSIDIELIQTFPSKKIEGFRIRTEEGHVYEFLEKEITHGYTRCGTGYNPSPPTIDEHASSWYLSKIIDKNNRDRFAFIYHSDDDDIVTPQPNFSTSNSFMVDPDLESYPSLPVFDIWANQFVQYVCEDIGTGTCVASRTLTTPYLSYINHSVDGVDIQKLLFFSDDERLDLNGARRLFSIQHIIEGEGRVKEFRFDHEFVLSTPPQGVVPDETEPGQFRRNRMFLKRLTEIGGIAETGGIGPSGSHQPYEFEYLKPEDLPNKNSFQIDHWGFYNGQTYNDDHSHGTSIGGHFVGTPVPALTDEENHTLTYGYYYIDAATGADRSPHPELCKTGLLTSMKLSTGGEVKYNWEPHEYFDEDFDIYDCENRDLVEVELIASPTYQEQEATTVTFSHEQTVNFSLKLVPVNWIVEEGYENGALEVGPDGLINCKGNLLHAEMSLINLQINKINEDGEFENFLADNSDYNFATHLGVVSGDPEPETEINTTFSIDVEEGDEFQFIVNSSNGECGTAILRFNYEELGGVKPCDQMRGHKGGGVRIKSIEELDGIDDANTIKRDFEYSTDHPSGNCRKSSGQLFHKVRYYYVHHLRPPNNSQFSVGPTRPMECDRVVITGNNILGASTSQGSNVAYSEVTEKIEGNGKTVSKYSIYIPDYVQEEFPFAPAVSQSHRRGQLVEETIYKESPVCFDLPIKKSTFEYETDRLGMISGVKVGSLSPNPPINVEKENFKFGYYHFYIDRVYQTSKTETTFDENGENPVLTYTEYGYRDEYPYFNKTEVTVHPDGQTQTKVVLFPSDYLDSPIHQEMTNRHILSSPYAIVQQGIVENISAWIYGQTVPGGSDIVLSQELDLTENRQMNYTYDPMGNVSQFSDPSSDLTTTIHWDAETNTLPVAQVISTASTAPRVTIFQYYPDRKLEFKADLINYDTGGGESYTVGGGSGLGPAYSVAGTFLHNYFYYDVFNRLQRTERDDGLQTYQILQADYTGDENGIIQPNTVNTINERGIHINRYYDGLGREIQNVSSDWGVMLNNIIEYDEFDRAPKSWLPYNPPSLFDYVPSTTAQNDQFNFYQNIETVNGGQTAPYSTTVFEASPLNRPKAIVLEGGIGTTTYSYMTATDTDLVRKWDELTPVGHYSAGELLKTSTTDENGNTTIVFSNTAGQKILDRKKVSGTGGLQNVDTYFVYEPSGGKGQLRFVIQPEASADLTKIQDFHFEYQYDFRGRMVSKKVPGRQAETFQYYNVGTPDLLEWHTTTLETLNYEYTPFGEVELVTNSEGEEVIKNYYSFLSNGLLDQDGQDRICSTAPIYQGSLTDADPDGNQYLEAYVGKLLYSKVKVLGEESDEIEDYVYHRFWYDKYGRQKAECYKNHTGGIDRTVNVYNTSGDLIRTKLEHEFEGNDIIPVEKEYVYHEKSNRLLEMHLGINGSSMFKIFTNEYDELGQLKTKRHFSGCSSTDALQEIDYRYNIRGWLTDINDIDEGCTELEDASEVEPEIPNDRGRLDGSSGSNCLVDTKFSILDLYNLASNNFEDPNAKDAFVTFLAEVYDQFDIENISIDGTNSSLSGSMDINYLIDELSFNGVIVSQEAYITTPAISAMEAVELFDFLEVEPNDLHHSRKDKTKAGRLLKFYDAARAAEYPAEYERLSNSLYILVSEICKAYEEESPSLAKEENHHYKTPIDQVGGQDFFSMRLHYNDISEANLDQFVLAEPQFNGNISVARWRTATDCVQRGYSYNYDELNRLSRARYRASDTHAEASNWNQEIHRFNLITKYDLVGNPTRLIRKGLYNDYVEDPIQLHFKKVDNLTYHYSGTQIQRIDDSAVQTPVGESFYKSSGPLGTEYQYDGNGNMIRDLNKKVLIWYNHLNLPSGIRLNPPNKYQLIWYDANGNKLRMSNCTQILVGAGNNPHAIDANATFEMSCEHKDYIKGFEYLDGEVLGYYHEEGRLAPDPNNEEQFFFEYSIKDHLGNSRVNYHVLYPCTGDTEIEITQEAHYYPFGGKMGDISNNYFYTNADDGESFVGSTEQTNFYQYNGKEANNYLNLNLYDYGARWYDPAIARWTSVDPLAEVYNSWSPYHYTYNNPINFVDPDGRSIWSKAVKGIGKIGSKVSKNGFGALMDAATYAEAFEGVIEDAQTVFDSGASKGDRFIAGASLLSEVLPVSVGDAKDAYNVVDNLIDGSKTTSKAARRQSMRDAGIPTSQPLIPDKATKSKDKVFLTRDKNHTVQDAKNDISHKGEPHWEAGPTKKNANNPDGLNRSGFETNKPQMGKPKSKTYYDEK